GYPCTAGLDPVSAGADPGPAGGAALLVDPVRLAAAGLDRLGPAGDPLAEVVADAGGRRLGAGGAPGSAGRHRLGRPGADAPAVTELLVAAVGRLAGGRRHALLRLAAGPTRLVAGGDHPGRAGP